MIKEIEGTNLVAVDNKEMSKGSIPKDDIKFVGIVIKGKIDFDVAPYVEENGLGCYNNYKNIPDNKYTCLSKEESFYSRLAANGIYFENPLHKITAHDYAFYLGDEPTLNKEWQSYEDRIVEKLLIIEKL